MILLRASVRKFSIMDRAGYFALMLSDQHTFPSDRRGPHTKGIFMKDLFPK